MPAAIIFDMDGLLIDSEPLWQEVEAREFGALGIALTPADLAATTGLRIDEVARLRLDALPPPRPPAEEVAARIVAGVVDAVRSRGAAKPGAVAAVHAARDYGAKVALATSSARALIDATLERLELTGQFDVVHSAADETYGKPHPAVFLTTASRLGVAPTECLVLEDSLTGVIAAKAARMRCVAVPELSSPPPAFAVADAVIASLEQVDVAFFRGFDAGA